MTRLNISGVEPKGRLNTGGAELMPRLESRRARAIPPQARRLALPAILAATVLLAGCGGGGEAETPAPPTQDPSTASTVSNDPSATTDPNASTTAATGATTEIPLTSAKAGDLPDLDGGDNSLFGNKFVLEDALGASSTTATSTTGAPDVQDPDAVPPSTDCSASGPRTTYVSAKINLDGHAYTVRKGSVFPSDTQQFTLESIAKDEVVVTLTAGEFSDGSDGITLVKGDPVSLMNQSEGITYKLELTRTVPSSTSAPTNTFSYC